MQALDIQQQVGVVELLAVGGADAAILIAHHRKIGQQAAQHGRVDPLAAIELVVAAQAHQQVVAAGAHQAVAALEAFGAK